MYERWQYKNHKMMNSSVTDAGSAGFPGNSVSEESTCNAGDWGSNPGLGRYPGEGKGNPLQYFYLENPTDKGAWKATVHGVARVGHGLVTKAPPAGFA